MSTALRLILAALSLASSLWFCEWLFDVHATLGQAISYYAVVPILISIFDRLTNTRTKL